jgi:hypothetical protein
MRLWPISVAPPERQEALDDELELLDAAVAAHHTHPRDREIAPVTDPRGPA